jgi:signal transduction histidine kinase
MSGFCELLAARTPEDDPRRAFVDEILRECLRCQRLVSDLLGFARSRPERKASVDLGELMEETLNLIRAKASSQGVSILLEKGRASAYADREQLKQVALNLLLNALEAMPRGGVLALRVEERGASARFEVRDSGPGLPEGLREKVFDPFYTTKEGGTGLGLAVSRAIVEAHGGAIALDDAPGGGARATVELPVKGEADVAAA